jgi:tryptophan-rich sensory protein
MKFTIFKFLCLASLLSAHGILARHAASASVSTNAVSTKKTSRPRTLAFLSRSSNSNIINALEMIPRGGACSDSNPVLFAKIGTTSILESAALFGILRSSVKLAASDSYPSWVPSVFGEPLVELLASFLVVFGSSFVGAIVDGGMSAATNQALNPNKVLGDPDWYANLARPWWNPPGWVFPIMWLIVSKPTQLCAMSRLLKFGIKGNEKESMLALAAYTTHLALGNVSSVWFVCFCLFRSFSCCCV